MTHDSHTPQMTASRLLQEEKAPYAKVDPPCPYFGTCGGCSLQDLSYQDQLALKRERLRSALTGLEGVAPFELIGLEDPWRYRNKAELTFGESNGRVILGYHAARSFWRVVDLDDCLLLPEPAARVLRDVRSLVNQTGLPAYHPRTHRGIFRHLLVRSSRSTGQVLIGVMTTSGTSPGIAPSASPLREVMDGMARTLMERHPSLVSVYWGLTNRVADVAIPEELILLRGAAHLEEQFGPFRIQLHPLSFLQPSSLQADRLYTMLSQAIGEFATGVAWDLYCGIGLIAFYLAAHVQKIYGIDVEARHIELAKHNASLNGLSNIEFRVGQVERLLMDRRFWLQEAKPDVVVLDPPRAGLHPHALSSLLAARPRRIAYLSCNVHSLIRDLRVLCSSFPRYRIARLQAFDMFPQTNHVELFAVLERA